jgi:hypothetical protein
MPLSSQLSPAEASHPGKSEHSLVPPAPPGKAPPEPPVLAPPEAIAPPEPTAPPDGAAPDPPLGGVAPPPPTPPAPDPRIGPGSPLLWPPQATNKQAQLNHVAVARSTSMFPNIPSPALSATPSATWHGNLPAPIQSPSNIPRPRARSPAQSVRIHCPCRQRRSSPNIGTWKVKKG